ncbi:GNAT family N-acetyltransferase [Helicobacter sp. 12S02232-10]|uniref:GNAT family N-acetyltransferase n=1 Tax=Helicobacter sp. 12S02232-10 TaxID=1476197 RepID=UPI000BA533E2|nr:GNAT family N-acetyltransferase [Helicobacter sp. 12S02232-10]PAF48326.1 GNAT family N-acetyltransferase [Helicobacter sp. 12S02232-10]
MENTDKSFQYSIRDLTTDDIDQYNALLRYAFQVTEEDLINAGWRDDEIKQSKFPVLERADILGCYDGENLISQFAVYPLKMNIYNMIYTVGFVTSVSTYPEYSGKGIMNRLMKKSLSRMREKHQSLALLYPYSIPLYRKYGWEIISNKISYRIKDTQIPSKTKAPGYVRRVNWDNDDFMDLHTRFAKQTHGCLFRNALAWQEYWRWDEDDTAVAIYYNVQNEPLGYMVYLIKRDVMHIKEMIYLNREAQKGLWGYIHAHDSMIDEVAGNTYFNEPVAFDMDDGDIREIIRPYIMGRITDVEQFFLQYRCDPFEKNVRISFEITDSVLDWNNRVFVVLFHEGKCSITSDKPDYSVGMDIATLTTLLLGYKTVMQLCRLERIEGDDYSIQRLDDVILHESPYISDYI